MKSENEIRSEYQKNRAETQITQLMPPAARAMFHKMLENLIAGTYKMALTDLISELDDAHFNIDEIDSVQESLHAQLKQKWR